MHLLKVCGITNSADARLAVELGADLIGIIFAENSARNVTIDQAVEIASTINRRCKLVGVFQNQDDAFIEGVRSKCPIDLVQLHGDETCESARKHVPSIKAISFTAPNTLPDFCEYYSHSNYLLFDRAKASYDETFLDKAIPAILAATPEQPFFMAGGINARNVSIVIERLKPLSTFVGIDVASAIESSPGKKDPKLMTDFITAFKEASHHAISR